MKKRFQIYMLGSAERIDVLAEGEVKCLQVEQVLISGVGSIKYDQPANNVASYLTGRNVATYAVQEIEP